MQNKTMQNKDKNSSKNAADDSTAPGTHGTHGDENTTPENIKEQNPPPNPPPNSPRDSLQENYSSQTSVLPEDTIETPPSAAAAEQANDKNGDGDMALALGNRLQNARLKKNLTLDVIAEELKIRQNYLQAFEQANYDKLPEATYAVGFVKSYAKYLGLSADEAADEFRQGFGAQKQNTQISGLREVPKSRASLHYIFLAAVIACVIIYIIWLGYNQPAHTEAETQISTTAPQTLSPTLSTETITDTGISDSSNLKEFQ